MNWFDNEDDISHKEFKKLMEELRWQNQLLYTLLARQGIEIDLERKEIRLINDIRHDLKPRLSAVKIQFKGVSAMPVGPVVLTVGQTKVATVVGFDQNGAPFAGPVPAPVFSIDNPAVATLDPTSGLTTGVSAGVANATATVVSAEGLTLTDTETVTVTAVVPVLSSVKISFD